MSFGINSGQSIGLQASTANVINYSISGLLTNGNTQTPNTFFSGQLSSTSVAGFSPASAGDLWTITDISLFNTSGAGPVTVSVYRDGATATNQVWAATIPVGGSALYGGGIWQVFNANGSVVNLIGPTGWTGPSGGPTGN